MKRSPRKQHDEHLDFGERVAKLVSRTPTAQELYPELLQLAAEVIPSTSQSLFLCDQPNGQLREVASHGDKADLIDFVPFDLGSGLSAWVGREKRPVRVRRSHRRAEPSAAFMAAPLLVIDQLVGVLTLSDNRRDAFSEEELAAVEALGAQVAVGLEQRLAQERLAKLTERADRAQERLAAMAAELEATKHELAKQVHAIGLIDRTIAPLTTIRHTAEYLLTQQGNADPKVKQRLETIHAEACRTRQLLEKIQQLSGQSGTLVGTATVESLSR
ncbi:MAG: GAF domain-containing protein [bacterium]